jgi:hypothetical protein
MKLEQLSGVAAIAFAAMTVTAWADTMGTGTPADCMGCTVTVFFNNSADGAPPLPVGSTPLNLGTSATQGFQNANQISNPGDGINTITFTGGSSGTAVAGFKDGLYAGSTTDVALSPFGSGDTTTNYLVAQPNVNSTDGVAINFFNQQNSFNLVWGTVDSLNNENLLDLTLSAGAASLSGMDIANIITNAGGTFSQGAQNVSVEITGLPSFTTITASDESTNSAFEFDPLVVVANRSVPAPPIGHGLAAVLAVCGGLFGFKLWERSKKRRALGIATPLAAA